MKTGYSFGSLASFVETINNTTVKLTGNQTIAGIKTFSSNPISSAAQGSGGSYLTRKDYVDGALALKAPLASPTLTGTPKAPTAAAGTNTTQIATTAFVQSTATSIVTAKASSAAPLMDGTATAGTSTNYAREGHIHPTDTTKFDKVGGTITGATTMDSTLSVTGKLLGAAEIQSSNKDSFRIAYGDYGAFWRNDGITYYLMFTKSGDKWGSYGTLRPFYVNVTTGKVSMSNGVAVSGGLDVDVVAVSGNLTAPTTPQGTNNTQVATTAFVQSTAASAVTAKASSAAPLMDGVATSGTSTNYAREGHIHPTDTSRAPLASPTLTGTPKAPTAAAGTNTTQLATTAFVQSTAASIVTAKASSAAPLMDGVATSGTSTNYAREGHIHPTDTSRAPLVSPALTGIPTAPTAAAGTNTTQIATTAFVQVMKIEVAKMLYPVGSYYANDANSANPATLFGFGTWTRVDGRVLMGCDGTGSGTFGTPGSQGGALTHGHTATGTAITEGQMPAHGHTIRMNVSGTGSEDCINGYIHCDDSNGRTPLAVSVAAHLAANSTGGGQTHTHTIQSASSLPPYRVVYLWRRTA